MEKSALDSRRVKEVLGWDFVRHDFGGRELRVLFVILFKLGEDGIARFERSLFEERLGMRSDHVLDVLRDLQRARVLKPGWTDGVFVLEPRSEFWKRAELAPGAVLAQGLLPMESGDDGVRFAQAVAAQGFADFGGLADAGVLPASVDRVAPQFGECFPKMGKEDEKVFPQNGEGLAARSSSPALAAAGAGFPKMGKSSVPQNRDGNVVQRLNVSAKDRTLERCNVSSSNDPRIGEFPATARRLSDSDERELIARTRAFVGEDDWAHWGGCWVKHLIRKVPEIVERALADRELMVKEGRTMRFPGRALWYTCKEFGADPKALFGQ